MRSALLKLLANSAPLELGHGSAAFNIVSKQLVLSTWKTMECNTCLRKQACHHHDLRFLRTPQLKTSPKERPRRQKQAQLQHETVRNSNTTEEKVDDGWPETVK